MNSSIPDGNVVLHNRLRYSIMSLVSKPTETAAYNEYAVSLYS